jgi:hypothetical protein
MMMEKRKKSWNGFQREAYDSIHRDLENALKNKVSWTVEKLSQLPLGSEKLRLIRGEKRSRQSIYEHLRFFEEKGQVRRVGRGTWTWVWETEAELLRSEIRELPEIKELKKACEKGDLLYSYNKRMFQEPEKDEIILALKGSLPPKEKRKREAYSRQIGCMYVHTDIEEKTRLWSFLESWRDRFLIKEPYFLTDVFSWLLNNRGIIATLGLDIEFFTGKKPIRELPREKIKEIRKAIFGKAKFIQLVLSVDLETLFKWFETPNGKDLIATIFSEPKLRSKAEAISSDWAFGEKLGERLRK